MVPVCIINEIKFIRIYGVDPVRKTRPKSKKWMNLIQKKLLINIQVVVDIANNHLKILVNNPGQFSPQKEVGLKLGNFYYF